jgi:hypothetical protein
VPEVVEDGVTGVVVEDLAQLPAAIDSAQDLDPADSRRRAAEHFDIPVMAAGYERVYRMLVEGTQSIRDLTAAQAATKAAS